MVPSPTAFLLWSVAARGWPLALGHGERRGGSGEGLCQSRIEERQASPKKHFQQLLSSRVITFFLQIFLLDDIEQMAKLRSEHDENGERRT
ncbi:hypothetical protein BDV95DRAFT_569813 [Massariosphaeria phaeospora]|uniref:Uncharacterized protein n=1 Tax=Massariosphaeria phaeospora TaxID=100035 RepID=A0A7C8IAR0_9PLEO|nr:hypothetical protein BDV95DRAFT_569813 [Massariosphaeria phaeospora]